MTNEAFFNTHNKSGLVALVGGSSLIDKGIKKAQKAIQNNNQSSLFSHAFIINEKRIDGRWWVLESDLEIHKKQIKLGVQENRINKFFNEDDYPNVALLDFNLTPNQTQQLLAEGLNQIANRATYSIREIFGVLLSFSKKELREQENKFSQQNSFICSSFVQHCYLQAGITFQPKIALKHLTPQDIYQTDLPFKIEEIIRDKGDKKRLPI